MKARITFEQPILGTLSGNPEIAEEFILTKHPEGISKDELEAQSHLPEVTEKSSTVFARNLQGEPMLWDYQIKGFFKEACAAMIHTDTMTKEELKKVRLTDYLHKKTIDNLIFVFPRQIPLKMPEGCNGELPFCQRPLRGQTMRGERISLARSEEAPAGAIIEIEIKCLNDKLEDFVKQWLTYGALKGMGQWRNSGKGRFSWEELTS
jgi:hypothetical protein